jgi:hypothetical protein
MNCEESSKMLFDYLWGTLDAELASKIKAHLESGCQSCMDELELLRGSTYAIASDLPHIRPPAELKRHVMNRISAADQILTDSISSEVQRVVPFNQTQVSDGNLHVSPSTPTASDSSWRRWAPALAGCFIGAVFGYTAVRTAMRPSAEMEHRHASIERDVSQDSVSSVRFVKLASTASSGDQGVQPAGHVVFDLIAGQVHVLTSNLSDAPSTVGYEVWLTDDQNQSVRLGELKKSDKEGVWFNYFDLPNTKMNIDQIAIAQSDNTPDRLSDQEVRMVVRITPPLTIRP